MVESLRRSTRKKAADQFRDCCVKNTLNLPQRDSIARAWWIAQKNGLYDWIQNLLNPMKSKKLKEARRDGGGSFAPSYPLSRVAVARRTNHSCTDMIR
jgi:hypothetical protein